jgi:carbon storage regulator
VGLRRRLAWIIHIDKEVVRVLVLSRRERERIRLGDSIVITVVRVAGERVRLGIEAPPDVLVLRDELRAHTDPEMAQPADPG